MIPLVLDKEVTIPPKKYTNYNRAQVHTYTKSITAQFPVQNHDPCGSSQ